MCVSRPSPSRRATGRARYHERVKLSSCEQRAWLSWPRWGHSEAPISNYSKWGAKAPRGLPKRKVQEGKDDDVTRAIEYPPLFEPKRALVDTFGEAPHHLMPWKRAGWQVGTAIPPVSGQKQADRVATGACAAKGRPPRPRPRPWGILGIIGESSGRALGQPSPVDGSDPEGQAGDELRQRCYLAANGRFWVCRHHGKGFTCSPYTVRVLFASKSALKRRKALSCTGVGASSAAHLPAQGSL